MRVNNPDATIKLFIITGRGKHSSGKAVLRPLVKQYLLDNRIKFVEVSKGGAFK